MSAHEPYSRQKTSDLLALLGDESQGESFTLDDLLDRFGTRSFGLMLIVSTLPAFLPVPVGMGSISGVLALLLGLQMMVGMEHPWLPAAWRRRPIARASVQRLMSRLRPWFARMERLCQPRWVNLFHGQWPRLTGLLIALQGLALSLPIPFTNYPFALVILALGVSLTEDDGVLLALCWLGVAVTVFFTGSLAGGVFEVIARWFS